MGEKYVAYVGSYTDTSNAKGITLFDVDVETGYLFKRAEYNCHNASYICASKDNRFLYAITDIGVSSFKICPDGTLKKLNTAPIRGMRGCHLSATKDNTYLFVSGYYDGKITVLRLNEDGSVGAITDGIFHQGPGSIAERANRPHVRCAALSPDEEFLFVVDSGIDQYKIYRFDKINGTLHGIDAIHCKLAAGPRFIRFSNDGRFFYSIKEILNTLSVYKYERGVKGPNYQLVHSVSTLGKKFSEFSAATFFRLTDDNKFLFCTNAGDNSVAMFERDEETGMLTQRMCLPISGKYPTSVCTFPDDKHLFVTNVDSDSLTFFTIDYEQNLLVMHGKPITVPQPASALILKLPEIPAEGEE